MGMSVDAIGGVGIIIDLSKLTDEQAEEMDGGFWPMTDSPLICQQVGAYLDEQVYFLGVGTSRDWNDGVDAEPHPLPDNAVIREMILDFLKTQSLGDGTCEVLFSEEGFGLHVYPYVS